jgi:hypothetical protein
VNQLVGPILFRNAIVAAGESGLESSASDEGAEDGVTPVTD